MPRDETKETFLDEEFLRRLEQIKILVQRGIRGPFKGEHISPKSGASMEFLDYRKYQAGDDFRYVDWNVYGRLDRLFIKLFRSEEDLNIHILLDMSSSMGYRNVSKSTYAKKIAAALAYIGLVRLDRVCVNSFNTSLNEMRSPVRNRQSYSSIVDYLLSLGPKGETDINSSLTQYATECRHPGLAIVISDLLDPKGYQLGLELLRLSKFDVTLIQLLDHDELNPSLNGDFIVREVETGDERKLTIDTDAVESYKERIGTFLEEIGRFCRNSEIDYFLCDTEKPFEDFLLDYLTRSVVFG